MTDDELEAKLRRLAPRAPEPDWDAMAADVRAAYERERGSGASDITRARRRRRWLAAPLLSGLALAAAFTLYLRAHRAPLPPLPIDDEAASIVDEADPGALIDELTPAQLDRVAQALKQGA